MSVAGSSSPWSAAPQAPLPAARVRETVEGVLAREEFQPPESTLWSRFFDWLGDVFDLFPDLSGSGAIVEWLAALSLAALATWVVLRLRRHLVLGRAHAVQAAREVDRVAERVSRLVAEAAAARDAGDRVRALRFYFFALVVGLGRRGSLEYRDTWTNRELLVRGRPSPEVEALLGPLVADLDAKTFGDEPATDADVGYLEDLCRRWLPGVLAAEVPADSSAARTGGPS